MFGSTMAAFIDDNFITSLNMLKDDDMKSPIKDFLKGKTVFLTGGFGFLGKLLISKLLRCEVKRIHLFVRGKKGLTPEDRFLKLKKEAVSRK